MSIGLEEARVRLAYINQHREVTLGGFLGLAGLAWVAGVPIPPQVMGLLLVWFLMSVAFVRVSRRATTEVRLMQRGFVYFLLEILVVTVLAHYTGAADWLAVMFYTFTILYANVVLPSRQGMWLTFFAAASFTSLAMAEYFHLIPHRSLFGVGPRYDDAAYVLATLLVGALGGYTLVAFTSSQFSRMLNSKAEALQSANQELRLAGQELQDHKDHLEELVRRRTGDLAQAYADLREANQGLLRLNALKNEIMANVSHELRTPLTSIRSFSEILLSYPDEEPQTRKEFLEIIIAESERLTRLIDDVLDLAKIEAGRMEWRPQPLHLGDVVRSSIEMMRLAAEQKGLRILYESPQAMPLVRADPDRVAQVITNLLSNALKFTQAGEIRVGLRAQDNEVLLSVADSGPGIPSGDLQTIFEKFHQRGETLKGKPAGTGLGLSICREIVQHHGGRIWAESEPGRGATFYCSFPTIGALAAVNQS